MPERVESVEVEGVDYGWVMQVTFVATILVGAPVVALLSAFVALPTWQAMATFAVRVGAVIWFLTALGVYLYARRRAAAGDPPTAEPDRASTGGGPDPDPDADD